MLSRRIIILIILQLYFFTAFSQKILPAAKNGVLDLQSWDFITDGNAQLKGEWEFYWSEFYNSKNFDSV